MTSPEVPGWIDKDDEKAVAQWEKIQARIDGNKINMQEAIREYNVWDNAEAVKMKAQDTKGPSPDDARKQKALEMAEAAKAQKEKDQALEQGKDGPER